MKRILSLILALTMIFAVLSMTACGEGVAETVENAIEKTEELDSYDATVEIKASLKTGNAVIEVPMTVVVKACGMDGENERVYAKSNMKIPGAELVTETYIENDIAYVITGNKKYKINLEKYDDSIKYDYAEFIEELMQDLPEELFANAEFVKGDNGKTVSVDIPDKAFGEIFDDLYEYIGKTAIGSDTAAVAASGAKASITVSKGYVREYLMKYTMKVGVKESAFSGEVEVKLSFNNIGKSVSVTAPEGYESFAPIN